MHKIASLSIIEGTAETRSQKDWAKGAKGQDFKARLEVAKRNHVTSSGRRTLEEEPLGSPKAGI